jgi:hypothetical protein
LFFSPMTILVSSSPYCSRSCLYLSLLHAPIYYTHNNSEASLVVLDEVGVQEGTQCAVEFIVTMRLLQEGLPSFRVDEHFLRSDQALQHLKLLFGEFRGSSSFLWFVVMGDILEGVVNAGIAVAFGEGVFLLLEVEGGAFVDLHGLGEHIDWLVGHLSGVIGAGLAARTGELASVPLVPVLLPLLLLAHGSRPLGSGFLLKVVDWIGEGVLSSEMLMYDFLACLLIITVLK